MFNIKDLSFSYQDTSILQHISCTIEQGDVVVIGGQSGCGKTTFLRHLKSELLPVGTKSGEVYFHTQRMDSAFDSSSKIGYVFQNPDDQIVSDKVYHEVAFGLENQKEDILVMRQKIAEMLHYFDMTSMYDQDTDSLSGGQKQILNLASVLVMQPEVLLLDEPLSQLDPTMQETFMNIVHKVNIEFNTTIIIVEHHYELVLPFCNKMMLLEKGKLVEYDSVDLVIQRMLINKHPLVGALPAYYRLYPYVEKIPATIQEARIALLHKRISSKKTRCQEPEEVFASFRDIYFSYDKEIIKGLDLDILHHDILGIIGNNGCGKTTLLKLLAGIEKDEKRKVKIRERIGYLSQDPTTMFLKDTAWEDLHTLKGVLEKDIQDMIVQMDLSDELSLHPYDLSGGKRQLLALAKVLLLKPKLLVLDEPTKGLDVFSKEKLGNLLVELSKEMTIIMVSHDLEFVAKFTKRCAMLFDGKLNIIGNTRDILKHNIFYTTTTRKIFKGIQEDILIYEDIVYE